MPDIDTLMQEWPEAVESVLSNMQLPSAALDVNIKEYTDILCSKV
jgi:intraflagellar transport protein 46